MSRVTSSLLAVVALVCWWTSQPEAQTGPATAPFDLKGGAGSTAPSDTRTATPSSTATTAHLTVQLVATPAAMSPGRPVVLSIEITPAPRMHVYAPGAHGYQVVRFRPDPQPWLRARAVQYPPSEIYHFVPLGERVETYQRPFTLTQELVVLDTPDARKRLAGEKTLTLRGVLDYQACDDTVCYAPAEVPLSVTLDLDARPRPKRDVQAPAGTPIGADPRVRISGQ